MASEIRPLHLATGDASSAAAIDGWLDECAIAAVICHEALDAVTLMLTEPEFEPACVFVGTDWLADDEHDVLDYLRAQWPRTWICIYGRSAARLVDRADDRMKGFADLPSLLELAASVLTPAAHSAVTKPNAEAAIRTEESAPQQPDVYASLDAEELPTFDAWSTAWPEPPSTEEPAEPVRRAERSQPSEQPPPNLEFVPPIVLDPAAMPPPPSPPSPPPSAPRRPRILSEEEFAALLRDHPDDERDPD